MTLVPQPGGVTDDMLPSATACGSQAAAHPPQAAACRCLPGHKALTHTVLQACFRVTHRARASASRPFPGLKRTAADGTPAGRSKGESGACARPNHIHSQPLALASVTAPAGVACPSFSTKLRERGGRDRVFGMQHPSGCRLGPVYHVAAAAERTLSSAGLGMQQLRRGQSQVMYTRCRPDGSGTAADPSPKAVCLGHQASSSPPQPL